LSNQGGQPLRHPIPERRHTLIQEPKAAPLDVLFCDEDSEEIMNDSLGTISFADTTGLDAEMKTEEEEEMERIGYSTDEQQD
jgi:hypothetical protein